MVVSTDRGDSWIPISSGLEINGTPYRYIVRFALSPTYEHDGTITALVWGPIRDPTARIGEGFGIPHGLFRSRDRGLTWSPAWSGSWGSIESAEQRITGPIRRADLVLSPRFADDGIGLLVATTSHGIGPSSGCEILRTDDHGDSWNLIPSG